MYIGLFTEQAAWKQVEGNLVFFSRYSTLLLNCWYKQHNRVFRSCRLASVMSASPCCKNRNGRFADFSTILALTRANDSFSFSRYWHWPRQRWPKLDKVGTDFLLESGFQRSCISVVVRIFRSCGEFFSAIAIKQKSLSSPSEWHNTFWASFGWSPSWHCQVTDFIGLRHDEMRSMKAFWSSPLPKTWHS
jgi:hypothetical protein